MPQEYKELNCRNVGFDCDFTARAETIERVIELCAAHATEQHGMKSFPPQLWVQMRRQTQTVVVDG